MTDDDAPVHGIDDRLTSICGAEWSRVAEIGVSMNLSGYITCPACLRVLDDVWQSRQTIPLRTDGEYPK